MIIEIKGYRHQTGEVNDYVLEEVGYDGYLDICKKTISQIENILNSNEVTDKDEVQALQELKESYLKTIKGEQKKVNRYYDNGVKYLFDLKVISKTVICPDLVFKKKKYKSQVTMFKDKWRKDDRLEISKFVGCLRLESDKYEQMNHFPS